jgi:hypothetical protein
MTDGLNIQVAQKLTGPAGGPKQPSLRAELIEIAEAVVLGLVAVATAWSGYQSARWDGKQGLLYGNSTRLRVEAGVAATEGGQQPPRHDVEAVLAGKGTAIDPTSSSRNSAARAAPTS